LAYQPQEIGEPIGGRAISLYERVFPFKRYNSPGAHLEFLRDLRSILPEECRPILVTDAGFRGLWFRAVEAYGWDWVGRIRNKIKYYRESTGRWCFTDSLYPQATTSPRYVGEVALSRRHRYQFRLYFVRAYKPRIGRPNAAGQRSPTRPCIDGFIVLRGCWQRRCRTSPAVTDESSRSLRSRCWAAPSRGVSLQDDCLRRRCACYFFRRGLTRRASAMGDFAGVSRVARTIFLGGFRLALD
jgi:hypothetical protein